MPFEPIHFSALIIFFLGSSTLSARNSTCSGFEPCFLRMCKDNWKGMFWNGLVPSNNGIAGFTVSKSNKCSGYLTQFQTFIPFINNICPLAKNEDLSQIPKIISNDACFDYLNTLQRCRVPTKNLPVNFTYECTHFISNTINYPSCINIHKNDKDFYQHEWRVYLKRSASLWKDRRENIILYDNQGKIVSTLTY